MQNFGFANSFGIFDVKDVRALDGQLPKMTTKSWSPTIEVDCLRTKDFTKNVCHYLNKLDTRRSSLYRCHTKTYCKSPLNRREFVSFLERLESEPKESEPKTVRENWIAVNRQKWWQCQDWNLVWLAWNYVLAMRFTWWSCSGSDRLRELIHHASYTLCFFLNKSLWANGISFVMVTDFILYSFFRNYVAWLTIVRRLIASQQWNLWIILIMSH